MSEYVPKYVCPHAFLGETSRLMQWDEPTPEGDTRQEGMLCDDCGIVFWAWPKEPL